VDTFIVIVKYGLNESGEWDLTIDDDGVPPLVTKSMLEEALDMSEAREVEDDDHLLDD
jgi:hypothetical protein